MSMKLLFEKSSKGRKAFSLPKLEVPKQKINIKESFLRKDNNLPELSEIEIVRHYTNLSSRNFGVDSGFYPLGSCTMKYNPKLNEDIVKMPEFTQIHPYQPQETVQGTLQTFYEMQEYLKEITGMDAITLQPAAGSHGELCGTMIMKAYFKHKKEDRKNIIIPDSSHGTNPASVVLAGFKPIEIKSDERGGINIEKLKEIVDENTAGLMLTNPNTLGVHDENIKEITQIIHKAGGLCYYDGANMNANLGISRPREMGFDIIHLNLHKTFGTPHGGGGPGSGPVGVVEELAEFLPKPIVIKKDEKYSLDYSNDFSIGQMKAYYGNYLVFLRAYAYIRFNGFDGLKKVSENAVLNANYLMKKLKKYYLLPYDRYCKHEFVLSDEDFPEGISTMDVAKRLLDYGYHAPTVYFPLIVHGAIMIEPTETETKETLDDFVETMIKIRKEIDENPEALKNAPQNTPVKRLDAVKAAKEPILKWERNKNEL